MGVVRIICINKDNGNHDNQHEAITNYGWINPVNNNSDKSRRETMVKYIEDGNSAFVQDMYGNKAYCYIRTSVSGNKFLQTKSDLTYTDNLLKLKECIG